jgi:hypothetical protein
VHHPFASRHRASCVLKSHSVTQAVTTKVILQLLDYIQYFVLSLGGLLSVGSGIAS